MSDLTKPENLALQDEESSESETPVPAPPELEESQTEAMPNEAIHFAEPLPPPEFSKQTRIIIGVGVIALVLVIYLLRLNNIVGLFVDDAWYVLLAKSLATGQGYALINSPTAGILPLYPPGFPALLSLFYRLFPHFPENLWLLKSVSIAAMIGAGAVSYYYFAHLRDCPKHLALMIGAGVSLCSPLVFLATSTTMSECVFTFSLIAAVTLIEKSVQQKGGWKYLAAGSVVASFAFLTRSMALGLLMAIGIYLLKERLFRSLLIFSSIVIVLCSPWVIYSRLHTPTSEQRNEQRGSIVEPYTTQLWQRVAGDPESGTISIGELPARVWTNFLGLAGRDLGRIVVAPIAEDLTREALQRRTESGEGQTFEFDAGSLLSFFLAAFTLLGFFFLVRDRVGLTELVVVFSLLITFLWPWEVLRFVLPLVPFLLFYLANGWRVLARVNQRLNETLNLRRQWIGASITVALIVLINLWGSTRPLFPSSQSVVKNSLNVGNSFEENRQLMQWIADTTPPESVIAAQNPPMVYLFTGRKTIASDAPETRWELWKNLNVVYWARTSTTPLGPVSEEERRYRIAFRSSGSLALRVLDLGNPQTRNPW